MGEVELVSFERAAGENPLAPGSRSPSPFPVEPGVSESAQPAASRPQEEARTNITAGSGGGSSVAPELTVLDRVREQYAKRALRSHNRIFNGPDTPRARKIQANVAFNLAAAGRVWELMQ